MYIYVFIYIRKIIHMCTYTRTYIYICIYTHVHMYVYTYICKYMYVVYVYMYVYISTVNICVYVHTYLCIYLFECYSTYIYYICIYTHVYICTFIYAHILNNPSLGSALCSCHMESGGFQGTPKTNYMLHVEIWMKSTTFLLFNIWHHPQKRRHSWWKDVVGQ